LKVEQKQRLRRFHRLRSVYYLLTELARFVTNSRPAVREQLVEAYAQGTDPWRYASLVRDRERYALALEMVARWQGERRPEALEVGCGEGLFTRQLATRCSSVVGADISEVALERARAACVNLPGVSFQRWDAVDDGSLGQFDLVTAMDVMEIGWRPLAQRSAMKTVTGSVRDGGALLITVFLRSPVIEHAHWARWLGRGGNGVLARYVAVDRRLVVRELHRTDHHLIALLEAAD